MTVLSRPIARGTVPALATAALLAVSAPAAHAQGCVGRPGASALQQYCEAVPEANGNRQSPQSGRSSSAGKSALPASSARVLDDEGDDGAAVAALAAGGGSGGSGGSGAAGAGGGGREAAKTDGTTRSVSLPSAPQGSALRAAKEAVETGPTAGPALAWSLLGMSVLGAAGAVFLRRRGATLPPTSDDA